MNWDEVFGGLRAELQDQIKTGHVRAERAPAYERLVEKMALIVPTLDDHDTPLADRVALNESVRGLMNEFQQFFIDPGAAPALGPRAEAVDGYVQDMKAWLLRELRETPGDHTAELLQRLSGDVIRAQEQVRQGDDTQVLAVEASLLRAAARAVSRLARARHLTLTRPLWESGEYVEVANAVFYSGESDLRDEITEIGYERRFTVDDTRRLQNHGQVRWDALNSCAVGVYDMRGWRPRSADPAGALRYAPVAYELGLAFALGQPVVVVVMEDDPLPFDIDLAPCRLGDDPAANRVALEQALDEAFYGRQRDGRVSCLAATLTELKRAAQDHPDAAFFDHEGWLDEKLLDDPVKMAGIVAQVLRTLPEPRWHVVYPAWPGAYPAPEGRSLFHVMPFSEPWSDAVRDTVREVSVGLGLIYRRGDEAEESRIIHAIWDDICRANVVVVDLTGFNPNVLVELGIAHALGRDVCLVRQKGEPSRLFGSIEKLRVHCYADATELKGLLEQKLSPPRTDAADGPRAT